MIEGPLEHHLAAGDQSNAADPLQKGPALLARKEGFRQEFERNDVENSVGIL